MTIVLAGNNLAAINALEIVVDAVGPDETLVIAPRADRRHEWQHSLAAAAAALDVPYLEPKDINDPGVVEAIRAVEPRLFVSVYYTQIFGEGLLNSVDGPMLNFHPSLLPQHRGTAPVVWAIVEGDDMTGLTVHHIDHGVDTGNIVAQYRMPIHPEDTGFGLHRKLAKLVGAAIRDILRPVLDGGSIPVGEPQSGAATCHRSTDPAVNHLDWSLDAEAIRNRVRALAPPLPGAYSFVGERRIVLARAEHAPTRSHAPTRAPGMIELVPNDGPWVWASDGPLRITHFFDGSEVRPGIELLADLHEGQLLS